MLDSIYKTWKTGAENNSLHFTNITPRNLTPPKYIFILYTFTLYKLIAISLFSSDNSSVN